MGTNLDIGSFVIVPIVFIFFMKNLMDLVRFIKPENRLLHPQIVWLLSLLFIRSILDIPFRVQLISYDYYFVVVYVQYGVVIFVSLFQIYLVSKIADSIVAEYKSRDIHLTRKPTFIAGICMCVFYISIVLAGYFHNVYVSTSMAFLYLISFIVYWVQTHRSKKTIFNFPIVMTEQDENSIFHGLE